MLITYESNFLLHSYCFAQGMKQAIGIALELNDDDLLAEPVKAAMKNASECATGRRREGGGSGDTYSMSTILVYMAMSVCSGGVAGRIEGERGGALGACAHTYSMYIEVSHFCEFMSSSPTSLCSYFVERSRNNDRCISNDKGDLFTHVEPV